jgi:phosphoribosylanthranilate isomerase
MWVKICGIRDATTAQQVAALRPDAIGLNFYARSPRCVARQVAREITATLPNSVAAVGVFVNHSLAEIVDLTTECRLSMLQLHGDEPPEFLAELQAKLPAVPLIRAWRMGHDLVELQSYLAACERLRVVLAGCLIDAKVPGNYGGSGQRPPWDVLQRAYRRETWPPLILAGGLTVDNVGDGIRTLQPWGVDVASGVESSPGVKNPDRVFRFLAEARR